MININKINEEKFKSIYFSYNFMLEVDDKMIAQNAILSSIMCKSCKKYKTQKDMEKHLYSLYGANYDVSIEKLGDIFNVEFKIECINKNFLPNNKDVVSECLEFLYQVIYNVDVENDEFDKIVFEREKQFIENKIKERKDDKLRYAVERTEELICDNSPFGLNVFGKEEDVKGVTSKQVYNEYLNLINNSYKNFIVSGNLKSYENIEEEIKNKFKEKLDSKKTYHDLQIDIKNQEDIINRNEIKEISEKQETSQSVITFGMSVDDYLEEDVYALNVYNAILGGTPSSKLFQIFRERESLAYTVRSRYYKFKKIFVIYAGIQKENYNRAKEVVFELLEGIVKGDISQEELNSAKDSIIADLLECEDSKIALAKMLNSNLLYYKNNEITIDIMISKIQQIQIQDVVNVSKKIKVKKIYLLGGETDV